MLKRTIPVLILLGFPLLCLSQSGLISKEKPSNSLKESGVILEIRPTSTNRFSLEVYIHNESETDIQIYRGLGFNDLKLEVYDGTNKLIKMKPTHEEDKSSADVIKVAEGSWQRLTIPKGESLLFKKIDLTKEYSLRKGLYKLIARKDVTVAIEAKEISIESAPINIKVD